MEVHDVTGKSPITVGHEKKAAGKALYCCQQAQGEVCMKLEHFAKYYTYTHSHADCTC